MTKNGGLIFVGRENELKILNRVFLSNRQESVLIYGRRRIGKTELKSCELNNLKANLGVGEFNFSGKLIGKSEIDSGVGAVNIRLNDNKTNYKFDVNKGIGKVTLDKQNNVTDGTYGDGENYLALNGGIGEIKIEFI